MLITNSAEGGSNGVAVTAANSGGASGTAWSTVNAGTGGSNVTFSSSGALFGSMGYAITTGGTADIGFTTWSTPLTPGLTMYSRGYFYFATTVTSIFRFFQLTNASFLSCGGIGTTAANKFKILNSAGTLVSTSTTTVPTNQWIRLDLMVFSDTSVGQIELKIFLSPNSTTPDETLTTPPTVNTRGGNIGGCVYGIDVGVANFTMYMDELGVADTGYISPAGVSAAALPWLSTF
jgi:hypothetical protein